MKAFIKHHLIYLLFYLALLGYTGNILLSDGKVQIHKAMNAAVGNPLFDAFFKYMTHLGDGLLALIVAGIFLFFSIRQSLYILLSYAGAGLVSYILKHVLYDDIYRPHFVFQYFVGEPMKEVAGVDLAGFHSFPSGHALSAFALFFCLLFLTNNHLLKFSCFILAVLAAYSRVYLSQHWLIDIYVGSIIGFSFSLVLYPLFYQSDKWPWLNTTLPTLLSNKNSKRV